MKAQRWVVHVGVAAGIGVFGLAPISSSQECPEYVDSLSVNRWFSSPSQIEVSGPYAHLGGYGGVFMVDIAAPQAPVVVGEEVVTEYKGYARVIDLSGSRNRVFFLAEVCGRALRCWRELFITEMSDSNSPVSLLSHYPGIDESSEEIVGFGETVLIASFNGLKILDVTDTANPVEVGFLTSPWGEPSGLVVEGALAYVALPGLGLKIIDVSDRTNPVEVGFWSADWNAFDLDVSNSIAYVADGDGGLRLIDASNPTEPTEVGMLATEHEAVSVSVAGNYAAVGLANEGIAIVNVTDKSDPVFVGLYPSEEEILDVDLVGSTAFALADGFRVLDVSFPESPSELSSFSFESSTMDVEISHGVMYVATGLSGLYVRNEANSEEVIESFVDTPGYALGVTLHGDLALVADGHKGLRIIDVSDSNNLVEVGFVDTPGEARRIKVAGDYAYVADGDGGLRIVDISTPEAPIEVGAVYTPGPAVDVAVEGNFAYVADGHLRVFDVSDPNHPIGIPYIDIPALAVETADDVLYLAHTGVSVLSLSMAEEPRPRLLASGAPFPMWREPTDITLSGDHVYVTTRVNKPPDEGGRRAWFIPSTLEVFEVKDLHFPSWVGRFKTYLSDIWAAAISDGRIYLTTAKPEITVLNNRCLTTYWVEIATHENGLGGSRWRSDVFVSNDADSSVDFDFVLHKIRGEFGATASVDAGHQGVFRDIVDLLGLRGTGVLEIRASNPVTVTSRVYSDSDSGTHGAFLQAHRSSDCIGSGKLYGLRQEEGKFRTNISVTNTTDAMHEVWIALYRTDGQELARYSVEVEPGTVVQDPQPFKHRAGQPNLGWGYAAVEGEQGILASAFVIDSRTNDVVIVPLLQ